MAAAAASFLLLIFLILSIAIILNENQAIAAGNANGNSSSSSSSNSDLIQKTCKSTKYYELCVSSLKSDPTSTKADTIKGLAVIMVGVGMANATATSTYLSSQLLTNTPTPNDTLIKKVLKDCADKYSYAGNALESCLEDLMEEGYDYADMHVMAAADYPNACRNAFKRYPGLGYPPELATRENGLKHICDVIMGIIDLIGS